MYFQVISKFAYRQEEDGDVTDDGDEEEEGEVPKRTSNKQSHRKLQDEEEEGSNAGKCTQPQRAAGRGGGRQ